LNNVLQHDLVERQVGDEAFQFGILLTELLQLARFARRHPAVHLLPAVVRLLRDPDLATDIPDRHAAFCLLQDRGNLLDGKALLLHGISFGPPGRIMPQSSRCRWSEKPGAPQVPIAR
jgi:hypothetical protein